jgi:hypothetical protein
VDSYLVAAVDRHFFAVSTVMNIANFEDIRIIF